MRIPVALILLLWASPAWAMRQVWTSTSTANLCTSGTCYEQLMGGGNNAVWNVDQENTEGEMPIGGVVSNLRISLDGSPDNGAGDQNWVFTVLHNGSTSILTCTISETATTCADTTNSFYVAATDEVNIQAEASNTPTARQARVAVLFDSDTPHRSAYLGGTANGSDSETTDRFYPLHANAGNDSDSEEVEMLFPTSGTIRDLYVEVRTAPTSTHSYTYTVMHNGTDTAIACTITGSATTCTDTSDTITIAAGDAIVMHRTGSGTPVATGHRTGIVFVADTNGEFILAHSSDNDMHTSTTEYDLTTTGDSSWTSTEAARQNVAPVNFEIQRIQVQLTNGTPSSSGNYRFALRLDSAASSPEVTCTVTTSATTCATSTTETIPTGSVIGTEVNPALTPLARRSNVAYLGFIEPTTAPHVMVY